MLFQKIREKGYFELFEILLSMVIILLIGWEIKLDYRELKLVNEEIRKATKQGEVLDSVLQKQESSLQAASHMSEILQKQLDIIAKEQEDRLGIKPRLRIIVNGAPLRGERDQRIEIPNLTEKSATLEVTILNDGSLFASGIRVAAVADRPEVNIGCELPPQPSLGHDTHKLQNRGCLIAVAVLSHRWIENARLTATYPGGIGEFRIGFTAQAMNVPEVSMGSIKIRPPQPR